MPFLKHYLYLVWFVKFGLHMLAIFMQCISSAAFSRTKTILALQHLQNIPSCYKFSAAVVVRVRLVISY